MPDDLDFDRARYTPLEPINRAPDPEFYRINSGDSSAFLRAIVFGLGAAIVGSLVYAAFTIATHIVIGYVALGVGYMVGKAMMAGSGQRGGRNYQIASAILTYLAVSMTAVTEILWSLHQRGATLGHISPELGFVLLKYGLTSPFLGLTNGIGGIISLFILFIALRAAWRLTSASANTASHPFAAS